MDTKELITSLQTLMAALPTAINALGAIAGAPASDKPDTDNDAVAGVDIDNDADNLEKVEPEDRKLDAVPAAAVAPTDPNVTKVDEKKSEKKAEDAIPESVPAVPEAPKSEECRLEEEEEPEEKKLEEEEDPEEKKLEEGDEDKKILEYVKGKFGKSLDEIQGKLFAMEGEADKTVKLQAALKETKKLSRAQVTEANLSVAIKEGKISAQAKDRIEEFRKLSPTAQKVFLSKSVSIFDSVTQPTIGETVKVALQKTSSNSRVVDCMPFKNRK